MKNNSKDEIFCRSITIVNDDGKPCISLGADKDGGRIVLSNSVGGKSSAIGIDFIEGKDPAISLHRNGKLILSIGVLPDGGYILIKGADGKSKHLLYVDDARGKILSGNDVFERDIE